MICVGAAGGRAPPRPARRGPARHAGAEGRRPGDARPPRHAGRGEGQRRRPAALRQLPVRRLRSRLRHPRRRTRDGRRPDRHAVELPGQGDRPGGCRVARSARGWASTCPTKATASAPARRSRRCSSPGSPPARWPRCAAAFEAPRVTWGPYRTVRQAIERDADLSTAHPMFAMLRAARHRQLSRPRLAARLRPRAAPAGRAGARPGPAHRRDPARGAGPDRGRGRRAARRGCRGRPCGLKCLERSA